MMQKWSGLVAFSHSWVTWISHSCMQEKCESDSDCYNGSVYKVISHSHCLEYGLFCFTATLREGRPIRVDESERIYIIVMYGHGHSDSRHWISSFLQCGRIALLQYYNVFSLPTCGCHSQAVTLHAAFRRGQWLPHAYRGRTLDALGSAKFSKGYHLFPGSSITFNVFQLVVTQEIIVPCSSAIPLIFRRNLAWHCKEYTIITNKIVFFSCQGLTDIRGYEIFLCLFSGYI